MTESILSSLGEGVYGNWDDRPLGNTSFNLVSVLLDETQDQNRLKQWADSEHKSNEVLETVYGLPYHGKNNYEVSRD